MRPSGAVGAVARSLDIGMVERRRREFDATQKHGFVDMRRKRHVVIDAVIFRLDSNSYSVTRRNIPDAVVFLNLRHDAFRQWKDE